MRLWIQTDCKAMAELLSGRVVLEAPQHRPLFVRLARALLKLQHMGLALVTDWSDNILWAPREFNTVADHIANICMDKRCSFTQLHEGLAALHRQGPNVRLCTDGGRRSQTVGALGVAVYVATIDEKGVYRYSLAGRRGVLLEEVESAFLAEALALEFICSGGYDHIGFKNICMHVS